MIQDIAESTIHGLLFGAGIKTASTWLGYKVLVLVSYKEAVLISAISFLASKMIRNVVPSTENTSEANDSSLERETLAQRRWSIINDHLIPTVAALVAGVLTAYCLGLNPTVATALNIHYAALVAIGVFSISIDSLLLLGEYEPKEGQS